MTCSTLSRWENDSKLNVVFDIAKSIKNLNKTTNISILAPHCYGAKKYELIDGIKIYRYKYFFEKLEKLHYNGGIISNIKKNKILLFQVPFSVLAQLFYIFKLYKKNKFDIIHAHWILPQGLIAVLFKLIIKKTKVICTSHGSDAFILQNKISNKIKLFILKNSDAVSTVSTRQKKQLTKFGADKKQIYVIHNGIDGSFISDDVINLKQKHKLNLYTLLFVGRLVEIKGLKYLIQAMPEVVKVFPKIKLLIIGKGNMHETLSRLVCTLGLNHCVLFLSHVPNSEISDYYKHADIFIGPSIVAKNKGTEGLGMVFLESLLCGTPVITTDSGGMTDIIKHNKTGIIVPQKNSQAISDAIIELLKNEDLRNRLSKNGKLFVKENFNWEKIAREYYQVYVNINQNKS